MNFTKTNDWPHFFLPITNNKKGNETDVETGKNVYSGHLRGWVFLYW